MAGSAILGRVLGVGRVGYGTVGSDGESFVVEEDWTAANFPTLAGRYRMDDYGLYAEDLRQGRAVVIADVRDDPRTAASAATRWRPSPSAPWSTCPSSRRAGRCGAVRQRRPPALLERAGDRLHPQNRGTDPPGGRETTGRGAARPAEPRAVPPAQEHDGDGHEHRASDPARHPGARAGRGVREAHPGAGLGPRPAAAQELDGGGPGRGVPRSPEHRGRRAAFSPSTAPTCRSAPGRVSPRRCSFTSWRPTPPSTAASRETRGASSCAGGSRADRANRSWCSAGASTADLPWSLPPGAASDRA